MYKIPYGKSVMEVKIMAIKVKGENASVNIIPEGPVIIPVVKNKSGRSIS